MEKTKNIPKIRFKGYNDEWGKNTIDSLGLITTGTTPRTSIRSYYNGKRLFASPADIYGQRLLYRTAKTLSDEGFEVARQASAGDSLFVCIGATIGKIIQINQDTAFNQQINAVSPTEEFDKNFVYSLLNSNSSKIVSKNSAQTMPILNKSEFSKKEVFLTLNYEEQKQIGSLFKNLDEKLEIEREKYEKLVNFKKAMLENVFPKEGEKRPKIRFGGYNDEWGKRRLGDVVIFRRGSFPQPYGKDEWYDGEGSMPFVQVADIGKKMKLENNTNQRISLLAQPKSIFANAGTVIVSLQGSIGRVAITQYDAYIDRTVLIFEKYIEEIDKNFWAYLIRLKFKNEALKAPGGTIKTITKEVLSEFSLTIPSINEQKLIGSFFKNLDEKIQVSEEKISKIENFKKAMMDGLFV